MRCSGPVQDRDPNHGIVNNLTSALNVELYDNQSDFQFRFELLILSQVVISSIVAAKYDYEIVIF